MCKIIAIDGPAGAGKSTTARLVASRLGYTYLDSGAIYRAITLAALENEVALEDERAVVELARKLDVKFQTEQDKNRVFLNIREVTEAIRSAEVDKAVTPVAGISEVRKIVVERVRELAKGKNVVAEGRDVATVIFPDADLKIYLDASVEKRAQRRKLEYQTRGETVHLEELAGEMRRRDEADKSREEGALKIAPGSVCIDTTGLSIEQQVEKILKLAGERFDVFKTGEHKVHPYGKRMKWFYFLAWSFVRNLGRILWRLSWDGVENIPKEGAVIIASNHISYCDPPLVAVSCPREVHFMAKKELFSIPVLGFLIWRLNAFPIHRQGVDRQALEKGIEVLKSGRALLVFPEGTRSRKKGEFLPPKPGVGVLAKEAGAPIVPAYISRSDELAKVFFTLARVKVRFGVPISAEWIASTDDGKEGYRQIAEEVMRRIGEIKSSCKTEKGV